MRFAQDERYGFGNCLTVSSKSLIQVQVTYSMTEMISTSTL